MLSAFPVANEQYAIHTTVRVFRPAINGFDAQQSAKSHKRSAPSRWPGRIVHKIVDKSALRGTLIVIGTM